MVTSRPPTRIDPEPVAGAVIWKSCGQPVADVAGEQRADAGRHQVVQQVEVAVEHRHALLDVQPGVTFLLVSQQKVEWRGGEVAHHPPSGVLSGRDRAVITA
jgi:hypothetical protein